MMNGVIQTLGCSAPCANHVAMVSIAPLLIVLVGVLGYALGTFASTVIFHLL